MISKIIQKEKERQDELKKVMMKAFEPGMFQREERSKTLAMQKQHKQSLINLKEYLKEIVCKTANAKIEYDIKELIKMIKRYK